MPSPAAHVHRRGVQRARTLRDATVDVRLRPMSREDVQTFAHAYLASLVAVWEAYLNELAHNFYQATANPLRIDYHAMHEVARMASERAMERFNTPNWENARNFLIHKRKSAVDGGGAPRDGSVFQQSGPQDG